MLVMHRNRSVRVESLFSFSYRLGAGAAFVANGLARTGRPGVGSIAFLRYPEPIVPKSRLRGRCKNAVGPTVPVRPATGRAGFRTRSRPTTTSVIVAPILRSENVGWGGFLVSNCPKSRKTPIVHSTRLAAHVFRERSRNGRGDALWTRGGKKTPSRRSRAVSDGEHDADVNARGATGTPKNGVGKQKANK